MRGLGVDLSSTAAMRVCQPGPVAFHVAMTPGGRRKDSNRFGFANLGRPRRTSFRPRRRSASSIQESVISGASSRLEVRTELFRFALMTVPHADNPACGSSRRPHEHLQSSIEPSCRNVTGLSVIEAIIDPREMKPGEHFPDTTHVETPLLQRLETLRWVACDAHRLTVATFNRAVNPCDDRHAVLANG